MLPVVHLCALMRDTGDTLVTLVGGAYPPDRDVHEEQGYFDVRAPVRALYGDVPSER
ncbi:hypothetical protein ABZV75_22010 [Streptomyces flaveolus]|uniref:hypothetical protein n=1 Tax=Streptomyces flaveolus TaxID=67297 RepID=UPI0033ABBDF2